MKNLIIKKNNLLILGLFICFLFFVFIFSCTEFLMLERVVLPILISFISACGIYLFLKTYCKDKFVGKIYLISILVHFIFILFWQLLKYYILGLNLPTDNSLKSFISDTDGTIYHEIGTFLSNNYTFNLLKEGYYGGLFPKIIATLYFVFGVNPFIITCFNSIIASFISVVIYLMSKDVLKDKNLCKIYSLFCTFCTSYIVNTSVVIRDGYITLFIYLSIYMSFLLVKTKNILYLLLLLFSLYLIFLFRPYAAIVTIIGISLGFLYKNIQFKITKNGLRYNNIYNLIVIITVPIILFLLIFVINFLITNGILFIKDLSVETLINVRETSYAVSNSSYSWDFGALYSKNFLLPFIVGYLCLFFAPFPTEWIYIKRLHFIPDMLMLYMLIPSFLKNIFNILKYKNYILLVYLFTLFSMFTIYCITVGNSGTIHRLRGPYIPMIYLIAMSRPNRFLNKILYKIQKWRII